jgi:hypothetical protein
MKCTSSVRGSTRPSTSAPFTFMVTWVFGIFIPPSTIDLNVGPHPEERPLGRVSKDGSG